MNATNALILAAILVFLDALPKSFLGPDYVPPAVQAARVAKRTVGMGGVVLGVLIINGSNPKLGAQLAWLVLAGILIATHKTLLGIFAKFTPAKGLSGYGSLNPLGNEEQWSGR